MTWNRRGLAALAFIVACSDVAQDEVITTDGPMQPDPPSSIELTWDECPDGFASTCARIDVPLDWAVPEGERISVLVARRPAPVQPATTQLWLVMGGPGDSADVFAEQGLVDALALLDPHTDVYVMEHRGVGESTWLGCEPPPEPNDPGAVNIPAAAMRDCLDQVQATWGEGLAAMTARMAAHDMHAVIEATRQPEQRVVLYGVSYGTLLVQRFLQLFKEDIDAVVLDSLFAPDAQFMHEYDQQWDEVARILAEHCAVDPTCSSNLGQTPWARIRDIVARFEAGHCSEVGLDPSRLGPLSFHLIDNPVLREHLFALLHRIDRCTSEDIEVVQHYLRVVGELVNVPSPRSSDLLRAHIVLSEEWGERSVPVDDVLQACEDAVFCPEVSATLAGYLEFWPTYDEPLQGSWPTFGMPVLVMQGELDAKTPLWTARSIERQLDGSHQHFVVFNGVTHVVIANSQTVDGALLPCGLRIMGQFVEDPTGPLDTSCTSQLWPVDFDGDVATNERFFGTSDRWN